MLHTTLVLSVVPSFSLLNRNFPPNNPSALSIFNYRLGLSYLTYCRHAAISCHGSTHTRSKQRCVNLIKRFDGINLVHNNVGFAKCNSKLSKKARKRVRERLTYLTMLAYPARCASQLLRANT